MTTSYLPYQPEQQHLLPLALQDWLPEGHLAYYINDTVDALDLSAFHARYAGGWFAQPAVPSVDDGQGVGVWICDGRVFIEEAGQETPGRHRHSRASGWEYAGAPDDQRLSRVTSWRVGAIVCASRTAGPGMWPSQAGYDRDRWYQAQGQCLAIRISSKGAQSRPRRSSRTARCRI